MGAIANLVDLDHLNIANCLCVSRSGFQKIATLKHLKYLNISQNRLVEFIDIQTLVTRLPNLLELHLNACRGIDDRCIEIIASKLLKLEVLDFGGCSFVTNDSIEHIINGIKNLNNIVLFGSNVDLDGINLLTQKRPEIQIN